MERDRVETDDDRRREAEGAWRRYSDAVEAMNEADDVEDYQAIGVRLREALLSLAREHAHAGWLGEVQDPPRKDDFKGWMERFASRLCPGRRQRAYLNAVADKTWDLVGHVSRVVYEAR